MMEGKLDGKVLPENLHFAGIGGIGMSGLAQMAVSLGHHVSGSDRALESPENARIIDSLRKQGALLLPQDGSCYEKEPFPGATVYSSALEKDNPDFAAAPEGFPFLHRSKAMEALLRENQCEMNCAVAGTCGKTSVTAMLAEALKNLDAEPGLLAGGLVNAFRTETFAGNYRKGAGKYFVLDADESDKSLLNYPVDSALLLNIGTDHYSREELCRVFAEFLYHTGLLAVVEDKACLEMEARCKFRCPAHLNMILFSVDENAPSRIGNFPVVRGGGYTKERFGSFTFKLDGRKVYLPGPGLYTASNVCSVYAMLLQYGFSGKDAAEAVMEFHGVWRRFDFAGKTAAGARIYDDYAHNVEKIANAISAAKELASGKVFAIFQPHGYGPLGFMRKELYSALEHVLGVEDSFHFLPVYYAGGTTSFKPKAEEVAEEYSQLTSVYPTRYGYFESRKACRNFLAANAGKEDVILIMGARDNSLSDFARELSGEK